MATTPFYSTQATKINDQQSGKGVHSPVDPNQLHGRLRVAYFTYEIDTSANTHANNDIIHLTTVPPDSRILGVYFSNEAIAATGAATLGDADDEDRLLTTFDMDTPVNGWQTLRIDSTTGLGAEPAIGFGYKYTAQTSIYMKVTTFTTPTNGAKIAGMIMYAVD